MNPFISCDWGTSSLRLVLVDQQGRAQSTYSNEQGIATVFRQWKEQGEKPAQRIRHFRSVLLAGLEQLERKAAVSLSNLPLVISGMASSNIGLYPLDWSIEALSLGSPRLPFVWMEADKEFPYRLLLIGGWRTETEVMRGEETILVGIGDVLPAGETICLLPGTHSKQVWISDGVAQRFQSFMTGEVFGLLSRQSLLADSLSEGGLITEIENHVAFTQGLEASANKDWLHQLFRVRTRQLLEGVKPGANYFYLSGLLTGYELRSLTKAEASLVIVGNADQIDRYQLALQFFGRKIAAVFSAEEAILRGQSRLLEQFSAG